MRAFRALLRRELAFAWGGGGGPLISLGFFAAAVVLLPLAVGPDRLRLAAVSIGATWAALVLATLLSLDGLFQRDFEVGALDLLALGPAPLELVCLVKCLAAWVTAGAPLALAAPLAAISLGAAPALAPRLILVAALGGLALVLIGGAGAALALASRRGGMLIALLVLPLAFPPVIFGSAAILVQGAQGAAALALLGAYSAAAAALSPLAMASASRNALS